MNNNFIIISFFCGFMMLVFSYSNTCLAGFQTNSERSMIKGSWSGFIHDTKGEIAKKIASQTHILKWAVIFDDKSTEMHSYLNSDNSMASTETKEDYPEWKFLSDATVVFDKFIMDFFKFGKAEFGPTYHTHMQEGNATSPISKSYGVYFSHEQENGIITAVESFDSEGHIMIWDGKEFQEIFLSGMTFLREGETSMMTPEQLIKMTPEQLNEIIEVLKAIID